jgi:hypothetical protein
MTYDQNDPILTDQADPYRQIVMPPRVRRGGRAVLLAGVAGAGLLGVGAGLWARPAANERQAAVARATPAPAPGPERKLQIVVDDRPVPVGAPIQVLPAADNARPLPAFQPPAVQPPEPQAPKRDGVSLMRILAPAFALAHEALRHETTAYSPMSAPPVASPKAQPAAKRVVDESLRLAQADARAYAKAEADRHARAEAAEHRAERKAELARAEQAKAMAAAHRVELTRAAKAERLEQIRLAKAEARGHARALAEAREQAHAAQLAQLEQAKKAEQARKQQVRLAALVRSLTHVPPHKAKPEPPAILTAKLDRRHGHKAAAHEPRIEQVSTRKPIQAAAPKLTRASHPLRPHVQPAAPQSRTSQPHASGLMKVSSHCASRDPGEAIVCADPNLGAADRQMSRAYQVARAAGVPEPELRQQQQHWLAARSSAAREAPWAVRDVYLARIAELNGQAREAHGDGY